MLSTLVFALCISDLILPVASHRSGHVAAHEIPHLQQAFMGDGLIDVTTDSDFFGLTTFANIPYVNCLKAAEGDGGRYDIAILGAPFDTVSGRTWSSMSCVNCAYRVLLVDQVLDLGQLGSVEDHSECLQAKLGIYTPVRSFVMYP